MSDATKHTAGEMHAGGLTDETGSDWVGLYVTGPDGEDIVIADARSLDVRLDVCDANAEHIAHCWNCHYELVAACEAALTLLDKQREEYNAALSVMPRPVVEEGPVAKALRAALARAGQAVPS